jgi:hypothetical protein
MLRIVKKTNLRLSFEAMFKKFGVMTTNDDLLNSSNFNNNPMSLYGQR